MDRRRASHSEGFQQLYNKHFIKKTTFPENNHKCNVEIERIVEAITEQLKTALKIKGEWNDYRVFPEMIWALKKLWKKKGV